MPDALNRSPLHDEHVALGARTAPFAGWEMPISYAGTVAEHTAVRTACGVFDVSHLGKILVRGAGGRALLDAALSNRMLDLEPGQARYTLMLDEDAGIVDDMIVYALGDELIVVPNAANVDEVERRLRAAEGAAAVAIERNDDVILALQGPRSRAVLDAVLPGTPALGYMHMALVDRCGVARSGYTGEHGYEIFVRPDDAPALWKAILAEGVEPCGLAARDTLRLEMGYPLHGNDIDRGTTPADAGLLWAVAKPKREALPPARKTLAGIAMRDRVIPRAHCAVLHGDRRIGECTSGTFSPTLKHGIALAYVEPESVRQGETVEVEVRGKRGTGMVTDPPFVASSPKSDPLPG